VKVGVIGDAAINDGNPDPGAIQAVLLRRYVRFHGRSEALVVVL